MVDDVDVTLKGNLPIRECDISHMVKGQPKAREQMDRKSAVETLKRVIGDLEKKRREIEESLPEPVPNLCDTKSDMERLQKRSEAVNAALQHAFEPQQKKILEAYWAIRVMPACNSLDDRILDPGRLQFILSGIKWYMGTEIRGHKT